MSAREVVKAEIMRRVEARLEQVLGEEAAVISMTLTEIEEAALRVGEAAQAAVTGQLVEAARQERDRACPGCGAEMRHKGYRDKVLITRSGEVKVRRAYYYCGQCQTGIFPPG